MNRHFIESTLRAELERLLADPRVSRESKALIEAELQRRDHIEDCRRDTLRYPELQRWFH